MAHVLIVDDDPDIRDVFRATLEWAGHSVAAVSNVRQARALVTVRMPDVVVLDLHFPDGGDAFTFAQEVRHAGDAAIVACSAHPDLYLKAQTTRELFAQVLQKPCDVLDLVRAVTYQV